MPSLIVLSKSISTGQKRLRAGWREPKKSEAQGHEWKVVALVAHLECSSVGSHAPALLCTHHPHICHDSGSYFGQWNLVEVICHFQVKPFKDKNLICHTHSLPLHSEGVSICFPPWKTVMSRAPSHPWQMWVRNKPYIRGVIEFEGFIPS